MGYTLFLRILIPFVCPLVAVIARLNTMVTYSLNQHDYHPAALARGISLHQRSPSAGLGLCPRPLSVQQVFVQRWVMVCVGLLRTRRFFVIPSTLAAVSIIPMLATSAR
jgi:hypothetical protein